MALFQRIFSQIFLLLMFFLLQGKTEPSKPGMEEILMQEFGGFDGPPVPPLGVPSNKGFGGPPGSDFGGPPRPPRPDFGGPPRSDFGGQPRDFGDSPRDFGGPPRDFGGPQRPDFRGPSRGNFDQPTGRDQPGGSQWKDNKRESQVWKCTFEYALSNPIVHSGLIHVLGVFKV